MILSENQLKVPGKMYKVRVKCVSTQRLTTIEWLILNCTKKFESLPSMKQKILKYAFEEVFQFQNSELLIKPCLKHLRRLDVIRIEGGDKFNYDSLRFADIELTELGDIMLKDGLLPGESREISLDIYYNPLTGKMSNFNNANANGKEVIDFGTESDYSDVFPERHIIDGLQSGSVGGGRFTASKFRIEEIESISSMDWESVVTLTVDVNDKNELKTNPEIIEPGVKRLFTDLFYTKEITKTLTQKLPDINDLEAKHIIGSSKKIKESILDVCKNGRIVFMDAKIYSQYKRNTASFKDTVLLLFNEDEGFSIDNEKELIIHIPGIFPIEGCVVVNEKGANVSLCKANYNYNEDVITIPLAIQDMRMIQNNKIAVKWLEDVIKEKSNEDIRYVALYTLPMLNNNIKKCRDNLRDRWSEMELADILTELNKIYITCMQLGTEMFEIDVFSDVMLKKIDFNDYQETLKSISAIMASYCIRKRSVSHQKMVESIVKKLKKPESYSEFFILLQSLGITTHDDALLYDNIVGVLYNKKIIKDIIVGIASGQFNRLPELFELDSFFNEYAQGLKQIENHVSGLTLFNKMELDALYQSVAACPDIAGLQSYMAEILAKNAYLMTQGINVYDVVKNADADKARAFFENMREIEKSIEREIQGAYQQVEMVTRTVTSSAEKKKMYVLDTCALMHKPKLLLYFTDEEYVRIPTKVIDELGKIKDKRNRKYDATLSDTARILARDIDAYYLKLFNHQNKVRFMIENAALDLLPSDLDPNVPDNQILSVALKYKDWDTYIVSDDGVFRLTSKAQNIQAITSEQFIESHKESYKPLVEWLKVTEVVSATETETKVAEPVTTQDPGNGQSETATTTEEFVEMSIDDMPIRELKKYVPDFNEPVFSFLAACKIKTIGDFRKLNESKVRSFAAKGKQLVYKNTVMRAVKQMDQIIPKIKL